MDTILGGFYFTFAYPGDIIISSKTKEPHREHLNKVFAQIREFGFKVKEAKYDFCMNKIRYLGHIIDNDGRRPDPERICLPLIMLRHYRASLDLHIRSNGQAERFADTLVRAFKKASGTRHDSNFCRYTESHPIPIHHWQSHQPRLCLPER